MEQEALKCFGNKAVLYWKWQEKRIAGRRQRGPGFAADRCANLSCGQGAQPWLCN